MLLPLPKLLLLLPLLRLLLLLLLLPLLHLLLLPKLPVPGADYPNQGPAPYSRGQHPEVPHNTAKASKLPYTA